MPFESNTETRRISVMKGSRRVLVKVVPFQLRGRSQPQNDAMANLFKKSKRPILGLSNEVSFVPEIFWKDVKIKETSFFSTRGCTNLMPAATVHTQDLYFVDW